MAFKYSPLGPKEFRLISLRPRFSISSKKDEQREELPISCTLSHFVRDKSPPYISLSYTWGDATNKVPIQLNNSTFDVTANLHAALQHIREDDSDVTLWIDALSINQEDGPEKTEQVKMMGDIYCGAEHTRAWLGPSTSGSDEAIAVLNQIGAVIIEKRLLGPMQELFRPPPTDVARYQVLETQIGEGLAPLVKNAIENKLPTLSFLDAAAEILSREYWKRVWILREVVVSSEVIFQCGSSTISFQQLYAGGACYMPLLGVHIVNSQIKKIDMMQNFDQDSSDVINFGLAVSTRAALIAPTTKIFGARVRYQQGQSDRSAIRNSLFELLARVHVTGALKACCGATNPRDRIFSLLGMATDTEKIGLLPDYDESKACAQIYTHAARAIINSGDVDLLCLSQPQGKESDIPSWVPDWRAEWILRPCGQLPWDTAFKAFTSSGTFHVSKTSPGSEAHAWDQLLLYGCQVDAIESLGRPWTPHYIEGCSGVGSTQAISDYLGDIKELCAKSDLKFSDTKHSIYSSKSARSLACKRVPVADQEEYGSMGFIRQAAASSDQGYADVTNDISASSTTRSPFSRSYRNMMGWQRDRRPFLSEKGYVGLAPLYVQEGDMIVLFANAKFPYVLRELKSRSDGAYSLVGEAYVHGIMYGEFFEGNVAGDRIRTFTLL